jgi:hypothetical protein
MAVWVFAQTVCVDREFLLLSAFLTCTALSDLRVELPQWLWGASTAVCFGCFILFAGELGRKHFSFAGAAMAFLYIFIYAARFDTLDISVIIAETVLAALAALLATCRAGYHFELVQPLLLGFCVSMVATIFAKSQGWRIAKVEKQLLFWIATTRRIFAVGIAYVYWPCQKERTESFPA